MEINYTWLSSNMIINNDATIPLITECSKLFSSNYGLWSEKAPKRAGKHVKLSPNRIIDLLRDKDSSLYYATEGELLVGYAIAITIVEAKYGRISWVTQLVVREEYRNKDIAKSY